MPDSGNRPPAPVSDVCAGQPQYEFNALENATIARLAARMNFLGIVFLAVGILVLVIGVLRLEAESTLASIIFLMMGIFTMTASVSFRDVVRTQGCDIRHLMHALENLRKIYSLQYWICLVLLLLLALTLAYDMIGGYLKLVG